MKKVLSFIVICISLAGCKPESDVSPANEKTFLRYFGSEYTHNAILALEAHDGYTLLSNIDIPIDALGNYIFKIRFIHTDVNGNIIWHKEYPSFDEVNVPTEVTGGFKASSFITLNSGYLIVGERINPDDKSDLLVVETDINGEVVETYTMSVDRTANPNESLKGHAITTDQDGQYILLGSIESPNTPKDMFVAKITTAYDSLWSYRYGDGDNSVINRIFYSSSKTELVWASSVVLGNSSNNQSDLRLVRAPQDSQGANASNPFGDPSFNETGSDICEALGGYAIIGTRQNNSGGDEDIILSLVSKNGTQLGSQVYFFNDNANDKGNSICQTDEGGLLILGTVESGIKGNGRKDMLLIKTDSQGGQEWMENYGGSENEEGASVRQTSDGSYLVYGTTSFGTLKKLMLLKVNAKGQL